MRPDRAFLLRHPAHCIALGFGAGLMPKAPGTWGTLVAFPLFFLVRPWGDVAVLGAGVAMFLIGIWASHVTGKALGVSDHGGIVIDEIAAFLIVLAFTPHHVLWWLAAFGLFRVFDILKPWPIRLADQRIKGGFGVMFDDLLAAGYAIAGLWIARTALS
jgi:phosphatidylglycerophosphatase A